MTFYQDGQNVRVSDGQDIVGRFSFKETEDGIVIYDLETSTGAGIAVMTQITREFKQRPIRFAITIEGDWQRLLRLYGLLGCKAEAIQMRYD